MSLGASLLPAFTSVLALADRAFNAL